VKLETRIRRQLKAHVEKRQGLITAPDELLDHILKEVEKWLAGQKQEYRISNSLVRMEVVDEISSEIRKEAR
jgi:hypothetical protein